MGKVQDLILGSNQSHLYSYAIPNQHVPGLTVVHREEVGNPSDYFEKTFGEYEQGFESNGGTFTILNYLGI